MHSLNKTSLLVTFSCMCILYFDHIYQPTEVPLVFHDGPPLFFPNSHILLVLNLDCLHEGKHTVSVSLSLA